MHLTSVSYFFVVIFVSVYSQLNDICSVNNGKRFYLEHGESGTLAADYNNNIWYEQNKSSTSNKCTVDFITCSSCVVNIKFRFLNMSRTCGKASLFDNCGCEYVWIYEPPIENGSGEQFCGRFLQNNASELIYVSKTRNVGLTFIYSSDYGHAFVLDYSVRRNRIVLNGYPKIGDINNVTQYISSPFFPYLYPTDLSVEYVITCESLSPCRISLIFTDFLIADSSIIEFFDWNGQRMYVTLGNIFRPPVIVSTGPSLIIRFYANGASSLGFKASYSYILGNINDSAVTPNIGCGGFVSNLGGAITMMNMVEEGIKFFDCVWIIKPPEILLHRKTHLYVKIVNFTDFAGTTEIVIRQGLTSNQPAVEIVKHPMAYFDVPKEIEHVVTITQGFYIRLRGHFGSQSQLAVVFAAFNYKDCFAGSDFLCNNLRCISLLLNCDGFDHCGDNSDESSECSLDPKDHREFSKIPNFLFPKMEPYSDIATATFMFLTCSFGLIGIILAMALLLHRVNVRAHQQRQIQDHIETIHAILEEGVGGVEEEIIIPDDPPDYEAPPDYEDILKLKFVKKIGVIKIHTKSSSQTMIKDAGDATIFKNRIYQTETESFISSAGPSKICRSTSVNVPDSPPPAYEHIRTITLRKNTCNSSSQLDNVEAGPSNMSLEIPDSTPRVKFQVGSFEDKEKSTKYFEYSSQIFTELRKSFRYCKSVSFIRQAKKIVSFSEENLVRYFSDSELIYHSDGNINNSSGNTNSTVKARKSKLKKSFSTADISLL